MNPVAFNVKILILKYYVILLFKILIDDFLKIINFGIMKALGFDALCLALWLMTYLTGFCLFFRVPQNISAIPSTHLYKLAAHRWVSQILPYKCPQAFGKSQNSMFVKETWKSSSFPLRQMLRDWKNFENATLLTIFFVSEITVFQVKICYLYYQIMGLLLLF